MFNSTIIDVAIGMIFVYLLLSLICSAANEIIETFTKKRASDLERGINELLDNNPDVVRTIYQHPLIYSLFPKPYSPGSKSLPSYIPARNFALALLDFATSSPAATAAQASANVSDVKPEVPPATPPDDTKDKAESAPAAPAAAASLAAELVAMRNTIQGNPAVPDNLKKALLALVDASVENPSKLRKNIENWFDSSMDRVSGWYKRRSHLIVLFLGLGIAVALNVDSIALVRSLSTERAMRDSLVSAAQEYAKSNQASAQTAPPRQTPAPVQTPSPVASPTPCVTADTPECRVQMNLAQIKQLGLPIGWTKQGFNDFTDFKRGTWLLNILGWLITALALSLGAPFWFDLLNKFIVVRSTVKPKEKSPEEESKD